MDALTQEALRYMKAGLENVEKMIITLRQIVPATPEEEESIRKTIEAIGKEREGMVAAYEGMKGLQKTTKGS